MPSIIPGYNYDIFISYRQNDNKYDGWVTEFVANLNKELEATIKDKVTVYFDANPHDGLLETHSVDRSLEDKLRCLIFIPILSRTYCDPKSYAWNNEFLAFLNIAREDNIGLIVKLSSGNVASRVLPVRIHDLNPEDVELVESSIGVIRSIDFIYKSSGVNRPLRANEDHPQDNLNKVYYRDQINKVANAIDEIIRSLKKVQNTSEGAKSKYGQPITKDLKEDQKRESYEHNRGKSKRWLIIALSMLLCIFGVFAIYKIVNNGRQSENVSERDKSIALLPFVNDSPDTNNLYFCNGMMEDILNHLVRINDIDVKSRTDVEPYRGVKKSRNDIAKELGVAYLLEGSVRKQGNSFRLMVQLIDARTGFHKWSQPYEGIYSDTIFIIQSEIAKKIAESLNAIISDEEKAEIEKLPTTDIRAYDYYIMANQEASKYWKYRDLNGMKNAQELLDKALRIDPKFEKAHRAKGGTFLAFQQYDSVLKYAEKILSINTKSAEGYYLKGEYFRFINNAEPAIEAYKNALKYYNKNETKAIKMIESYIGYLYCIYLSDYRTGLPYINKGLDDGNSATFAIAGITFAGIGDYEKVDKYFLKSLNEEIVPVDVWEYSILLTAQSRFTEALNMLDTVCTKSESLLYCARSRLIVHIPTKEFEKAQQDVKIILDSGSKLSGLDSVLIAIVYKNTGMEKESKEIMKRFINSIENKIEKGKSEWSTLYCISVNYAMLGEREKALDYLARAANHNLGMVVLDYFVILPPFDNLRDDPEFKAIVKRAKDDKARLREEVKQMELRGEINL